jgi:hypothetical protein
MKWINLKEMKCPKCSNSLYESNGGYACAAVKCEFYIRSERFNKIVDSMYKPKERSTEHMSEEQRLSELNNYGREPREMHDQ